MKNVEQASRQEARPGGDDDCEDPALIDDALDGDAAAFERLLDCNHDKLMLSMLKMLGCKEDAEEAVQDAFLNAFKRLSTFRRESKFSTWLHRIAFNAALSNRTKKRPRVSLDERYARGLDVVDSHSQAVDQDLLREEKVALVHKALSELTEEHRAILLMREFDDLAYQEIAERSGISVGTVRSRLSRARDRMSDVVASLQASIA